MDLGELTIETAMPLVGTTFNVSIGNGETTPLKLDEVLPFKPTGRRARRSVTQKREPFSLFFLGSPSLRLPQGTYDLIGKTATINGMFIVPISQDEEATEYEAIFT